jgi:hypothetical protein
MSPPIDWSKQRHGVASSSHEWRVSSRYLVSNDAGAAGHPAWVAGPNLACPTGSHRRPGRVELWS